jgi:hypothetical protein
MQLEGCYKFKDNVYRIWLKDVGRIRVLIKNIDFKTLTMLIFSDKIQWFPIMNFQFFELGRSEA